MTDAAFAPRITRAPRPFEADRAAEALERLPALDPALRDLVAGTAGCSPYLAGLIAREADWLAEVLERSPERALSDEMDAARRLAPDAAGVGLRTSKRRIALLVALADLGGVWPLGRVTGALTDFADLSVDVALRWALAPLVRRGKIPGQTEEDLARACGLSVIAMGKMGAGELNYSSDIDLICLFDETRFDPGDFAEARAAFVKATRTMTALLSDARRDGYVFRTDLRLRPDPSVTPVCLAMEAAERYYESLGRTWERAAFIKARAAAGDIAAGGRFLDTIAPFVWRRHLDYAAIEEAQDMRLRIRSHKGLHGDALERRNLKLAPGGIREIEFFTQTRQLIAGGRDPDLRVRGTVEGLSRLADKGWVARADADTLAADYAAHREVEHRLQMIADQQTHDLPGNDEGFARLAAFMGTDPDALRADVAARIARVSRLAEGFFVPGDPPPDESVRDLPDLTEAQREIVARWPGYPALRSDRAMRIFGRLRGALLTRLARLDRPDEALLHFDGFLSRLPAGVQLFALFEANPQLIDLILDISATAPGLAAYLARNAEVFDAVIAGDFFSDWPGTASLRDDLAARLGAMGDYETQLDEARRWQKEWHFRIGVHFLRDLTSAEEAGRQYADLADAVLAALWDAVCAEFAARHGPPPGQGAVVIGMGSLGARRLTATSDLDLIVVYDPGGREMSEGPRPLAARTYYARLTQALVTALSAPMAEGRLYEADMRLRPSGRQGPVATSVSAFESYHETEAWTWEHLALTRARVVAGPRPLAARVEAFRAALLARPRDADKVRADVADMRARLAAAQPGQGGLDAKSGPGRLLDIALAAQTAALLAGRPDRDVAAQVAGGREALGLSADESAALLAADALLWRVQAASRLIDPGRLDPARLGGGAAAILLRGSAARDIAGLEAALEAAAAMAVALIDRVIGPKEA